MFQSRFALALLEEQAAKPLLGATRAGLGDQRLLVVNLRVARASELPAVPARQAKTIDVSMAQQQPLSHALDGLFGLAESIEQL